MFRMVVAPCFAIGKLQAVPGEGGYKPYSGNLICFGGRFLRRRNFIE
jgi:hypothetical protein